MRGASGWRNAEACPTNCEPAMWRGRHKSAAATSPVNLLLPTPLLDLVKALPPRFALVGGNCSEDINEVQAERTNLEQRAIGSLRPYAGNARTHSRKQIKQIADSITRFGFTNPVLISDEGEIIAGHGRVSAAKLLGHETVPTLRLSHLSATERRAYVLADNKLALNAGWDQEILAIELQALIDLEFDPSVTGFSLAEVDFTLDAARERAPDTPAAADVVPPMAGAVVTRSGDVWQLGRHRLICGDARNEADYAQLLAGETVDLIFTDPPYNVPIDGHVCGSGRIRHREFAMGVGEMSSTAFIAFLTETLGAARSRCRDGAIAFVCMDWRHIGELSAAGAAVFSELKNYLRVEQDQCRDGHVLSLQARAGLRVQGRHRAAHVNSFGLGDTGRYRTNVWDYPGISSMGAGRLEELAMHPTVKPTALVADAIRDCSRRGDIVLDNFGGSGTTLIAAETCGRQARLIEYDPAYCDTIVRRWQQLTGKRVALLPGGTTFEDVEAERTIRAATEVADAR